MQGIENTPIIYYKGTRSTNHLSQHFAALLLVYLLASHFTDHYHTCDHRELHLIHYNHIIMSINRLIAHT